MPERPILIDGVPFIALGHHDGRFVRAAGLFVLARRDPDGGYTLLHFELSEAINCSATPGHDRWGWALGQGLDTPLIHLASRRTRMPDEAERATARPIRWHPEGQAPEAWTGPCADDRSDAERPRARAHGP